MKVVALCPELTPTIVLAAPLHGADIRVEPTLVAMISSVKRVCCGGCMHIM